MTAINLNVTIKDGSLDVDQDGNANHVPKTAGGSTITWRLIGNAHGGVFNAMNAANPGFAWKGNRPPDGIFGPAVPDSQGNMTMTDLNTNIQGASGTWCYQLWATINGQQYSTIATIPNPRAVTRDPTIVNN